MEKRFPYSEYMILSFRAPWHGSQGHWRTKTHEAGNTREICWCVSNSDPFDAHSRSSFPLTVGHCSLESLSEWRCIKRL
jgi:hypothetical protein